MLYVFLYFQAWTYLSFYWYAIKVFCNIGMPTLKFVETCSTDYCVLNVCQVLCVPENSIFHLSVVSICGF